MKIQTIVQFYLDAVFPRDPSWAGWKGVTLNASTFSASIRPWDPSREALFPNEIDESLSGAGLTLTPAYMSGGFISKTIADAVVDRIQVVLEEEVDEPAGPATPPVFDIEQAQDRAVDAANVLIEHIRVSAQASSLPRITRMWRPQDGKFYIQQPWTMAVLEADGGAPVPVFAGVNAALTSGAIRAPETGAGDVSAVEQSLSKGIEPPLYSMLLLEAESKIEAMAMREAILDIASACEVAAALYIDAKAGAGAESYKNQLRGSFATKYYKVAPLNFSARSLEQDDPSAYAQVEDMYRERNSLMHGGQMRQSFMDLSSRERQRTVYGYISAGHRAVEWVTALF